MLIAWDLDFSSLCRCGATGAEFARSQHTHGREAESWNGSKCPWTFRPAESGGSLNVPSCGIWRILEVLCCTGRESSVGEPFLLDFGIVRIRIRNMKVIKKSQNRKNLSFSYYFCLMMEGSGAGSVAGSGAGSGAGSIPVTNGSGRPKTIEILRMRIRIRIENVLK